MEQFHLYETREFHRLLEREWLERIERVLWDFAQDLDAWLHALFANPTPNWRDNLETFLTEQSAVGRELTPESREELAAFLENWAAQQFAPAEAEGMAQNDDAAQSSSSHVGQVEFTPRPPVKRKRGRFSERTGFDAYLEDAKRALDDLQKVVQEFAGTVNAAETGAETEVEPYLDQVEALIYRHNDSMEHARRLWLQGGLDREAHGRLVLVSNPGAFGLPRFIDKAQAERAKAQWKAIGKRSDQSIGTLDNVILAMQVTETAADVTTALMGAGLLVAAAKKGGKMVIVKAAARIVAAQVATPIIGQAVDAGLEAAGVDAEVVNKLHDAVDIINKLMMLRKLGGSLKKITDRRRKRTAARPEPNPKPDSETPSAAESKVAPARSAEPPPSPPRTAKAKEKWTQLVEMSTVDLGEWGEKQLALKLDGEGFKPKEAYKTSRGLRFIDRLVDGVAHEAKAGVNVRLTSTIRKQAMKDAELVAKGRIRQAHWHFFQGADENTLSFLKSLDIKYTIH